MFRFAGSRQRFGMLRCCWFLVSPSESSSVAWSSAGIVPALFDIVLSIPLLTHFLVGYCNDYRNLSEHVGPDRVDIPTMYCRGQQLVVVELRRTPPLDRSTGQTSTRSDVPRISRTHRWRTYRPPQPLEPIRLPIRSTPSICGCRKFEK